MQDWNKKVDELWDKMGSFGDKTVSKVGELGNEVGKNLVPQINLQARLYQNKEFSYLKQKPLKALRINLE